VSPKSRSRKRPPAPRGPRRSLPLSPEERAALTPRYTPPVPRKRLRPGWHRLAGWGQVVLGVALIVLNYAQDFGPVLLPGGHNELYFLAGLVVAAAGTWWLGVFDRPERPAR